VAVLAIFGAATCAELGRSGRPEAALALGVLVALLAAGGTTLLVRRLRVAQSLALRDPLTGLPNRILLDDRVQQALHRSRRTGEPFAVLVVDLDGFKEVNDVRGHEAGDEVLGSIARRLEGVVRASDTVARIGGDEFVVLSLDTGDELEAAVLAGRLRQALRRRLEIRGGSVEIDASIGCALHPVDGTTTEELLGRADNRMYRAKRDTSEISSMPRRTSLDSWVVNEFQGALDRNELAVHYQPILDVSSGSVRAVEALVRRVHPQRGILLPAEFMPHVERTPLIRALTLHVVSEALRQAGRWEQHGHVLGVSVNTPYRVIDDPELVDGIAQLLAKTETPHQRLTLEIVGGRTATALDRGMLEQLVRAGIRFSLDDFGMSSSLSVLRAVPLDEVKIDGGFVNGLGRHRVDHAIVQALVQLGHELGLDVVAECVESREAWETLAQLGCDHAQGFYVQAPVAADLLTEWLEDPWRAATELAS
jgi:diguanylate cyclase